MTYSIEIIEVDPKFLLDSESPTLAEDLQIAEGKRLLMAEITCGDQKKRLLSPLHDYVNLEEVISMVDYAHRQIREAIKAGIIRIE